MNSYDVYRMDENDRMLFQHLNIIDGTIDDLNSNVISFIFLQDVEEYRWIDETIFEYCYVTPEDELMDVLGVEQFNKLSEDELNELKYNYEYLEFVPSEDEQLITLTQVCRHDVTVKDDGSLKIHDKTHSNIFDHSIVQGRNINETINN